MLWESRHFTLRVALITRQPCLKASSELTPEYAGSTNKALSDVMEENEERTVIEVVSTHEVGRVNIADTALNNKKIKDPIELLEATRCYDHNPQDANTAVHLSRSLSFLAQLHPLNPRIN